LINPAINSAGHGMRDLGAQAPNVGFLRITCPVPQEGGIFEVVQPQGNQDRRSIGFKVALEHIIGAQLALRFTEGVCLPKDTLTRRWRNHLNGVEAG
jgi:hypothetical protein